jgi:hypothetical protein
VARAKSIAAAIAAAIAVTLAGASAAPAAKITAKKAMWGPLFVDGVSQFPVYADLGVGIVEHALPWGAVAATRPTHPRDPSDPAYEWPAELDAAMGEAGKYGIRMLLMINATPAWANGNRGAQWAPNDPKDLADFAYAASRHYRTVRHWMIWGEPTNSRNFQPLTPEKKRGVPLTAAGKVAPHRYAELVDAAYGALHAANARNLVIAGNSWTVGDISPYNWIRNLRLPNGRAPRMDMYGHNPFTARRPDLARPPLGKGYADFSDLDTLASWLDRYLRPPNRRGKPLKIFISEFLLPTDHYTSEVNFYVSRRTQATWIADALAIVRRSRRIATFGWFRLYDDKPNGSNRELTYGLLDWQGGRKPSYAAFRDS